MVSEHETIGIFICSDAYILLTSFGNQETAKGKEDHEEGDDVGPDMGDMRGGSDNIVLRNESLTR